MVGEIMDALEPSEDEVQVEALMKTLRDEGYHAECDGVKFPNDERTTYYALVMPQAEYQALVASISPDTTKLPWESLSQQENFVGGRATREQALRDAMQLHFNQ